MPIYGEQSNPITTVHYGGKHSKKRKTNKTRKNKRSKLTKPRPNAKNNGKTKMKTKKNYNRK